MAATGTGISSTTLIVQRKLGIKSQCCQPASALGSAWLVQDLPRASGWKQSFARALSFGSRGYSSEDVSRTSSHGRPVRSAPLTPLRHPGAHSPPARCLTILVHSMTRPHHRVPGRMPPPVHCWSAMKHAACLTDAVPSGVGPSPQAVAPVCSSRSAGLNEPPSHRLLHYRRPASCRWASPGLASTLRMSPLRCCAMFPVRQPLGCHLHCQQISR